MLGQTHRCWAKFRGREKVGTKGQVPRDWDQGRCNRWDGIEGPLPAQAGAAEAMGSTSQPAVR